MSVKGGQRKISTCGLRQPTANPRGEELLDYRAGVFSYGFLNEKVLPLLVVQPSGLLCGPHGD